MQFLDLHQQISRNSLIFLSCHAFCPFSPCFLSTSLSLSKSSPIIMHSMQIYGRFCPCLFYNIYQYFTIFVAFLFVCFASKLVSFLNLILSVVFLKPVFEYKHLLSLCSSAVNSQWLLCSPKAGV